ncbi:MAG: alpha/beta hydrolase [Pseudomonadales bacterium]
MPKPAEIVAAIEAKSRIQKTPCGEGQMPWRIWGQGVPVVLLHGGSGSWTHWIRNIEPLAERHKVIAADLPGLGDAGAVAKPYTAQEVGEIVRQGLISLLPQDESFHLVGFSWGCTVCTLIAADQRERVRSLTLVGPASLGSLPRGTRARPLLKRRRVMSEEELWELNRENLARHMFYDREQIDDLAIHTQVENTRRSRFNSPQFARTDVLFQAMKRVSAPLMVMWGEHDATAHPHFEARRKRLAQTKPDFELHLIEDVGHWTQYEGAQAFHSVLLDWLERH